MGGSVNVLPDGDGTVLVSRPTSENGQDSPDNGSAATGWRGIATSTGAGDLLVVHVFCAKASG